MENFPSKMSFDAGAAANSFFAPLGAYSDAYDQTKAALKYENFVSPYQGPQDLAKSRLPLFDSQSFYPPAKEEDEGQYLQEGIKAEHFPMDGQNFSLYPPGEQGFDMYNRITRSRGPSFNIGPGRKNSEDLFAHGFDYISYFNKNPEQHQRERGMSFDNFDPQFQNSLIDFRMNPLMAMPMMSGLANHLENYLQPGAQMQENLSTQEPSMYSFHTDEAPQQQQQQQQVPQESVTVNVKHEPQSLAEVEPKTKKKRKLNNNQEVQLPQEVEAPSVKAAQLKKSKSEIKKEHDAPAEPLPLKSSKSTIKPEPAKKASVPKTPKGKKGEKKAGVDADDKSTVTSSTNVSPFSKKEDLHGLLKNGFGSFKKPETAQELLGGLNLPAEVEEYINNSKIFNQIKAPVVRKIGTLTVEERRTKIEKYLEKRKRRSWNKRVNYDCRKKVADNRLRIKGRFVTKDQAFKMLEDLGIFPDPDKITNSEIKELLTERFGAIPQKKKEMMGFGTGEDLKDNSMGFVGMNSNGFGGIEETSSQEDSDSEKYLKD